MSSTVQFRKVTHDLDELKSLPTDQLAAFAAICHAVNEMNVFKKIFVFSVHPDPPKNSMGTALLIQQVSILRIWSAKIFESCDFLELKGKYNRSKDARLLEFSGIAKKQLKELKEDPGYQISKRFRHEATNHLSLSAARQNLKFVDEGISCESFIANEDGNCFFPFGEEVIFGGGFARLWEDLGLIPDSAFELWMEWNLKANRWVNDQHIRFFRELIAPLAPERQDELVNFDIGDALIGDSENVKLPLILREKP